ncbi:type I-E CRISPR-associated protein Cse2/CasB [Streptomyces sp. NPDC051018]|uniref:type I-E CRISPR-associated protein Cse2/CasB n=1 Tax=Streptomyces sp. NPDC051018 TaxID=3365639 RepID=UPI0037A0F2BD
MTVQTGAREERQTRRDAFVSHLHSLATARESDATHQVARGRAELAVLRRGFSGGRHQAQAYGVVVPYSPAEEEQDVWLLVSGLFALHPLPRSLGGPHAPTLARSLGALARVKGSSVERRFTDLVSVEGAALEHQVRQAVRLLHGSHTPLNYGQLLDDLVVLLSTDQTDHRVKERQRVRLRWISDYHHDPVARPRMADGEPGDDPGTPLDQAPDSTTQDDE